ncbi:hypothetical protein [Rhizobium leguminosarum]|uniref:hypothetical protein n=1 Tax=Rhizobium leguminosarum TaxID=384 RepID=UPI00197D1908|nr:hypothetical protein [Rhizobium leguminosarum]
MIIDITANQFDDFHEPVFVSMHHLGIKRGTGETSVRQALQYGAMIGRRNFGRHTLR